MTEGLPLAAPVWLFRALLLLTLVLHLIAMNTLAGGAIVAVVTGVRNKRDPHRSTMIDRYRTAAPVLVAATVTLGVAPLLFLQVLYGEFFFPSSVVMAWPWLSVVLLVMAAYAGTYALSWSRTLSNAQKTALQVAIAALLLLVGFLYTNNMTLMLSPARIAERYFTDARGVQLNLGEPTLVPRYLHFMLGAVAVAGLALAGMGAAGRKREPQFSAWAIRHGLHWFAGATAANVIVGIWWLVALAPETRAFFNGGDLYATTVLWLGSVAGLVALGASIVGIRNGGAVAPWVAVGATVVTIAAMTLSRDVVRQAALASHSSIVGGQAPVVAAQWLPIALFGVLLVAAIAVVAWMVTQLKAEQ